MGLGFILLVVAIYGFTRMLGTGDKREQLSIDPKWIDDPAQYNAAAKQLNEERWARGPFTRDIVTYVASWEIEDYV